MSADSASVSTPRNLPFTVVLTGNPNCGKTTLFNALTGLRGKVGNYAGVTVERKEGALSGAPVESPVTVLDLPGTYSLSPQSLDEQIARDILFQRLPEVPAPDLILVVVDASNLQRNLYYATQVIELGYPTVLALNMMDVARENGHEFALDALSKALGVPVVPLVASSGEGVGEVKAAILSAAAARRSRLDTGGRVRREVGIIPRTFLELPEIFGREAAAIESILAKSLPERRQLATAEAVLLLSDDLVFNAHPDFFPNSLRSTVAAARVRLEQVGVDWRSAAIEARYARVLAIQQHVTTETLVEGASFSDRLDQILTHRVWGLLIFVSLMVALFVSIFFFAKYPMDALKAAIDWLANQVGAALPPGDLNALLTKGIITGVGAVVVFLPQILLLFLFISLLEDSGYMARAAFLMDRLMSRVGLHGKSFIPMLSSFACAIPGIMATRTIETPKDRLATILVAPLMSCSARLPVYTVLIAACIGGGAWGQGLTLTAMYLLGIAGALGMAWIFKRTFLKGEPPMLILELPPYKRPVLTVVLRHMWDRSKLFLSRAGTVILGINILLWFLTTFPKVAAPDSLPSAPLTLERSVPGTNEVATAKSESDRAGAALRQSFAGRLGQLLEPVIRPLGFDWKIGIGIVTSFAAREVFVSTMSVVYNVGGGDGDGARTDLVEALKAERRENGFPVYTTLTGLTLMVFYVFALQCVSTVAIVRRETNGWKWPLFQLAYMTALAWIMAFITYQGGRWLGLD